ncbi:MAG: hypothetical protein K9G44_12445, partial [Melioribacteraceae bacterium]|nr:hypothetical protein [Melioribacteraceae bacterium]
MRRLSHILIIIMLAGTLAAQQSPHGENFELECSNCHSTQGWQINSSDMKFDHSETSFELDGMHSLVDCASCHESLVFAEAKSECSSCHNDIHQNSVGINCEDCHQTNTWIVSDINS